jgi:hypothetical protein
MLDSVRRLPRLFALLFACAFIAVVASTAVAQSLTFTTLAGTGGSGSADGTGRAARFHEPSGVAADRNGNVYVTDSGNDTVRKISPAGAVTTLAGTAGVSGFTDGTGAAARFRELRGATTDANGNVYVADNFTIRKITAAGVVTTFAGSPFSSGTEDGASDAARFRRPSGLATDTSGNLYVADFDANTIRKITPAGIVTTLAGSPDLNGSADGSGSAARFDQPFALATDSLGNVYVSDQNNFTVRKITPAGVVTTIAGRAGVSGIGDGAGNSALFWFPVGISTDATGNVYVADGDLASTIRKVTPAGVVTTFAGSAGLTGSADGLGSTASFAFLEGLAADSSGNLYVADWFNETIRKVTPAGVVTTLAGSAASGAEDGSGSTARFFFPSGIAADRSGNLYVPEANQTIRKITAAGVVTTFAGSAHQSGSNDGTGAAARFFFPGGAAADDNGNVYVADGDNVIRKITPGGVVTTLAGKVDVAGSTDGTGSSARFSGALGVATDANGNVYVADQVSNTIRKITPAGVVTTLAGLADAEGNTDGTGSTARFNFPAGVATDASGNVYVADTNNQVVRKITPMGVVTTFAGSGQFGSEDGAGTAAAFLYPEGIATDGSGNVYVAERNQVIRRITPAGVVTTVGGAPGLTGGADGTGSAARFNHPIGLATDAAGNVYVADALNHSIRVGRAALADIATIDFATGTVAATRQLSTNGQTATAWEWTLIRRPSGSNAALSSTTIRNPLFTPDVADVYVFQLTASNGTTRSITTVSLSATAAPATKRRSVRP